MEVVDWCPNLYFFPEEHWLGCNSCFESPQNCHGSTWGAEISAGSRSGMLASVSQEFNYYLIWFPG